MKKLVIMFTTCLVLGGCGDDKSDAFVGTWKNNDKSAQTMIISKIDGGYRVEAKFDDAQWSSMNTEVKLKAEDGNKLVTLDGQKKVLEQSSTKDELTSYLYTKPKVFKLVK